MKILKHQLWHILILTAMLFAMYYYSKYDTTLFNGNLWGISTFNWFIIAILSPIIHQIYVLICWRLELHYKSLSKLFGKNGFIFYKIGFAILIFSRLITIILLAVANSITIEIEPIFTYILSGLLIIPSVYLFYSVSKYFGMDRAFGIDHFEYEKVKNEPFVKHGIFKYTSNGMYVFGFLILWIPGILMQSKAAILIALFSHIYIWVHYYFTEQPDMKIIYKKAG